jgi:cytochrome P450
MAVHEPQDIAQRISGCPVRNDYDYWVSGRVPQAGFHEFDAIAAEVSPIFRSPRAQGYYVLTDYHAILEGLQNVELFSASATIPTEPDPLFTLIPLQLDEPEHAKWRKVLSKYFTPRRAELLSDDIRKRAVELIEAFAGRGQCDFVTDFAQLYPTSIFLAILGLPTDRLPQFLGWADAMLHGRGNAEVAAGELASYFNELLDHRAALSARPDDLISDSLTWEIDGVAAPREAVLNCLSMLFLAGLDTVASELTYAFYHLASHETHRKVLVEEPELVGNAVEELLRAFPIPTLARKAKSAGQIGGCPIGPGDMVAFPLTAAGRDPEVFTEPQQVDFRRSDVRHLTFGAGRHRCLGAHLARREMQIVLEEWHRRIPDYELDTSQPEPREHSGGVYGLDSLPLRWRV